MKRRLLLAVAFLCVTSACSGGANDSLSAKDEDICYRFERKWDGFDLYSIMTEADFPMGDLVAPVTTTPDSGKYDEIVQGILRPVPDYGWNPFIDEMRLSENDDLRSLGYSLADAVEAPEIGSSETKWLAWAFDLDVAIAVAVSTCQELRGR